MSQAALGLVGVGTMGQALARNLAAGGHQVAAFDRDPARIAALAAACPQAIASGDLSRLVAALKAPRLVLLMVNAGAPVDQVIAALAPLLQRGDAILDGGNSHYRDSERRAAALAAGGIDFLGVGISGGEDGARHGASVMVGGARAAYDRAAPLLAAIAARCDGTPCLGWFGGPGAGHFVKMVHNGIEYAVMQLIAETWAAMERLLGLGADEAAQRFAHWNAGAMQSYLLGITAELLAASDPLTGRPMLEVIGDRAGQKGTGQWTAAAALERGVPAPTLAEAVFARHLSALSDQRRAAAALRTAPPILNMESELAGAIAPALDTATLCAYAQGFALIRAASEEEGWATDLANVARVWRAGCIIRAACLEPIAAALGDTALPNLMLATAISQRVAQGVTDLRRVVAMGAAHGVAMPALASALAYVDAYGDTRLPSTLIQAQRDRFGRHGFERTDRAGLYHLDGSAA